MEYIYVTEIPLRLTKKAFLQN